MNNTDGWFQEPAICTTMVESLKHDSQTKWFYFYIEYMRVHIM